MRARLLRLADRIDRATLRERLLIFAALAVLILAVGDAILVEPEVARNKRLTRDLGQRQGEAGRLREQLTQLAGAQGSRFDAAMRERVQRARDEVERIERRIVDEQGGLARPEQMRTVLEELLGRNRRVSLVEIKTLEPLAASPSDPKSAPARSLPSKAAAERMVYRHGMEIVVAGPYLDLLQYLKELEHLPTRLYWGGAELDASRYPIVRLKLNVYTLSLDKAWMSV